jgi:hypothetical protein
MKERRRGGPRRRLSGCGEAGSGVEGQQKDSGARIRWSQRRMWSRWERGGIRVDWNVRVAADVGVVFRTTF